MRSPEPHALVTPRLALVPLTVEVADAALNDRDRMSSLLGARVSDEWPNADFAAALAVVRADVAASAEYAGWARVVVHTQDRIVIGDAGFKSMPVAGGEVEIGYGIVPAYQGRGLATEAAAALIDWAFSDHRVSAITAECREDNLASIRVLEKLAMERAGVGHTEEGPMIRWRLTRRARSASPGA
jgi:ribosomal-protein-alanine N-acetyltransferase